MRDRLPAPPAIHHYPVMPDMSVESDERMDESQVIYFIAPMALSIAFCLCFIRVVITGCMRLGRSRIHPPSSRRRVTAEGVVGGGVSVVQPNTTSCGLMGRAGFESLRHYLHCPYGEIFLQAPPPTYEDSQKARQSINVSEPVHVDLPAPDETLGPPPPSYPPSRQISTSPINAAANDNASGSSHVLTMRIEELIIRSQQHRCTCALSRGQQSPTVLLEIGGTPLTPPPSS